MRGVADRRVGEAFSSANYERARGMRIVGILGVGIYKKAIGQHRFRRFQPEQVSNSICAPLPSRNSERVLGLSTAVGVGPDHLDIVALQHGPCAAAERRGVRRRGLPAHGGKGSASEVALLWAMILATHSGGDRLDIGPRPTRQPQIRTGSHDGGRVGNGGDPRMMR